MATAEDVRGGPGRGRPRRSDIDRWNDAHPDDPYISAPPRGGNGNGHAPDYPDDDFDLNFPDSTGGAADFTEDQPSPVEPETAPRKITPRKRKAGGFHNPFAKPKTGAAKKKARPRVSTEDLLGSVWRGAAKLAAPMPPLQRTLRVQAPVAGILLEDAVRDTMVDTVLQPLARITDAGKTISALAGPPLFVAAMTLHMQHAAMANEAPNPILMGVASEGLRSSLMTWMDVAGPKFEAALAREREFEDKYGADVDQFIAWLFSPPPSNQEEAARDEAMIRHAMGANEPASA